MAVNAGEEVRVILVIRNKRMVAVEEGPGTERKVRRLETKDKDALFSNYRKTEYGLQPVRSEEGVNIEIYEHDTQGPNTCFMYIGNFQIEIPCS